MLAFEKGTMKHSILKAALLFLILNLWACDTVLGPPGSEPPEPPPGSYVPYDQMVEGQPNPSIITAQGGFFVWKEGNDWHVRTARLNMPHVVYPKDFVTGKIAVEAGLLVTNTRSATPPDDIRVGINDIYFRFEVEKDVKGLDFSVRPTNVFGYCVNFDVQINNLTNTQWVYLGRTAYSPVPLPAKICIRP